MINKTLVLSLVLLTIPIWTTNSYCQGITSTPDEVLQYGKLRYIGEVRRDWSKPQSISREVQTNTTLVHTSSIISSESYRGLPDRKKMEADAKHYKQYVRDLHSKGILVISYMTTTRFHGVPEKRDLFFDFYDHRWDQQYQDIFGPKPVDPVEWARLDSRGNPCVYNKTHQGGVQENAICFNHPAVEQYNRGFIKLQLALGSDGIFIDDAPIFCYCSFCNTKFRTHLKNNYNPDELIEIFEVNHVSEVDPRKFMEERLLNTENPLVTEWKRFRAVNYTEHLMELKAYGERLKPGFILSDNACLWEGDPYRVYDFAVGPIEEWAKGMSFIFIEPMMNVNPWGTKDLKRTNSPVLKYSAAAAHGIPTVYDGYLGDPYTDVHEKPLSALYPLVKLFIAECNANQVSYMSLPIWEGYANDRENPNKEIVQGVSEYHSFLAKNEDLFLGSKPYTNVALLISTEQTYAGYETYAMAVSRMLLDEHIPHVMIVDDDVKTEVLEQYDLIILPDVPMMSDEKINILEKYVENGGGLLSLGASSKYDEFGRMRKKLGLSRLFMGMEPWGHMDPSIDQTLGVNAISKNEYGKGRVLFIPSEAYASLPKTGREEVVIFKDLAFVTAAKLVSLNQVFGGLVQWAAGGSYPVHSFASNTVECHPLIQPEKSRIVVHLVNYKVDQEGNIIEEKDTKLKVLLPEGTKAKKVKLVSPDEVREKVLKMKELNEHGRNYIEFTVPSISIYSLAEIEYR